MDRWSCPECGNSLHTSPWWNGTAHEVDVYGLRVVADGELYCAGVGHGHTPVVMVRERAREAA